MALDPVALDPVLRSPSLSVILPVHNDQDALAACLDSLLTQTQDPLEVIGVDAGSVDHSGAILADYARRDPRVRLLRLTNGDLGQARLAGVAAATGEFLTFVDAADTIPPPAYAYLVSTLQRTGSDFAVGAVRGMKRGQSSRPSWVKDVHRVNRLRLRIDDFPDAMHDVIACNRVFRRDFYDAAVGPLAPRADQDSAPMVAAYLRARSFDLLSATTSTVRLREDAATVWQQKHQVSLLQRRIAAKEQAWQIVSAEAAPAVAAAWLGRVLDFDLSLMAEFAVQGDDEYRQVVTAAARRFTDLADPAAWTHVRVDRKLRVALAAAGDWAEVDRSIQYFRQHGSIPATRVVDGRVLAALPAGSHPPVPEHLWELGSSQTSLAAGISSVSWGDDRLRVEGWAYISALDLSGSAPGHEHPPSSITASLVSADGNVRLAVPVERWSSAAITRQANSANQRYDTAGFRLTIDPFQLRDAAVGAARWQLLLTARTHGLVRQGPVHTLLRTGVAMRMRAGTLSRDPDPVRVVPLVDDELGFVVEVRPERLRAITLASDGHHLEGRIRALDPSAVPVRVLARQDGKTVVRSRLTAGGDGDHSFTLALPARHRPASGAAAEHWEFRVQDEAGTLHRVAWPDERTAGHEIGPWGPGSTRWRRSPRGFVQLSSRATQLLAHDLEVTSAAVTVDVSLAGAEPTILSAAVLRTRELTVPVSAVEPLPGGRARLVFPAAAALWGSDRQRPLPTGSYGVVVPGVLPGGKPLRCAVAPELLERMPTELLTETHGVTLARRPGTDRLVVELRAPLADDERGREAQQRLESWYADTDFAPREAVFFQCYRGEFSTDSQRAIHEELHSRGTTLELVWGVQDLSVDLPEGATAVLLGSRAWYEAIGSATHLCNNNDFDHFFRRRDHQRFLQTFHGYPFKSMGVSHWQTRDLSPELIDYECRRRTEAWTSIVLPARFCEQLYRREYGYVGPVLVTGYPRNDTLVPVDPGRRDEVLRRLGVAPDKTAVLYAPTWRDTIATGDWSAEFFDALELDTLGEALGEDYVVLLRGHNFNMREGGLPKKAHAQVVDVTRYPEISDLIVAADVAVLDYSSLRFDWVLTGKPVLFFVPDLADYLSARTALFEYGPTAPGPLLSTTAEVIEAILDLDSVSMDYAQARIDFNERFNALHDGHATERVVDAFFPQVPGALMSATDGTEASRWRSVMDLLSDLAVTGLAVVGGALALHPDRLGPALLLLALAAVGAGVQIFLAIRDVDQVPWVLSCPPGACWLPVAPWL